MRIYMSAQEMYSEMIKCISEIKIDSSSKRKMKFLFCTSRRRQIIEREQVRWHLMEVGFKLSIQQVLIS